MARSYRRSCNRCGRLISLRRMPAGQWVAFENDEPHKCEVVPVSKIGAISDAPSRKLTHARSRQEPLPGLFDRESQTKARPVKKDLPKVGLPEAPSFDAFEIPDFHGLHSSKTSETSVQTKLATDISVKTFSGNGEERAPPLSVINVAVSQNNEPTQSSIVPKAIVPKQIDLPIVQFKDSRERRHSPYFWPLAAGCFCIGFLLAWRLFR